MSFTGPNLISKTTITTGFIAEAPISFFGTLYVVINNANSVSGNTTIAVFKSVDSGATWIERDTSNEPLFTNNITGSVVKGNQIWVTYTNPVGDVVVQPFTMGVDTWGAPSSFTSSVINIGSHLRIAIRSTGEIVIAYNGSGGCYLATWLSSWTNTDILINATGNVEPLIIGPGDQINILIRVGGVPNNYYYASYIGSTLSSPILAATMINGGSGQTGPGIYLVSIDTIMWPISQNVPGFGAHQDMVILSCTPSNAPVFSTVTLYSSVTPFGPLEPAIVQNSTSTIATLFFAPIHTAPGILSSTNNGSGWSTPALFFSPSPPPTLDFIPMYYSQISDAPCFALSISGIIDGTCGIAYYLSSCSSPPALACPVISTGVVGNAFSTKLLAPGLTPPLTFAVVSGSLPPGLSLNTITGVISGTPTTPGVYPYIITVTDSLGAVRRYDCSITILNSQNTPSNKCIILS